MIRQAVITDLDSIEEMYHEFFEHEKKVLHIHCFSGSDFIRPEEMQKI